MYTYLLVFQYTKNGNLYTKNKIVTLRLPLCVDDIEIQEEIASKEFEHKTWIINRFPLEPSRKPLK